MGTIRKDDTGFGGLVLLQDVDAFCYGIDAVLLADFSAAKHNERVIDLGAGNGAVSIIVWGKYAPEHITQLEVQKTSFELARQSIEMNGLKDRIDAVNGDVLNTREIFAAESFDLAVCNPPYVEKGRGMENQSTELLTARCETTAELSDFFAAAEYLLKKGGRLCIVHRPSRLPDLMVCGRNHGLEPKKIKFVVPRSGEHANLVLLEFVKGAGKELRILPELAVRTSSGNYTLEIEKIYGRA